MIEKQNLFFQTGYCTDSFSVMKMKGKLVENAQLIRKKHRETKFIFSPVLIGRMVFYYGSDREVSRECTIN